MSDNAGAKPKPGSTLSLIIGILVLAIVVVHATSWAFPVRAEKGPRLGIVDVLAWVGAVLLALYALKTRRLREVLRVPLPAALLVLLAIGSALFAENRLAAFADVVQYAEYFIVLYLLFVNVIATRERLRLVVTLWLLVSSIIAVWALVQYLNPAEVAPIDVKATFANRNLLGGYLALVLPMAWGLMLGSGGVGQLIQAVALAGVGFVVILAGGPWIAAAVGIVVISVARTPRLFPVLALMLLAAVLFIAPSLPRNNVKVLADSLAVYDESFQAPATKPGMDWIEVERMNPRYVEWQAAMKQLVPGAHENLGLTAKQHLRQLLLGRGIGGYQEALRQLRLRIRGGYQPPNRNVTEPDTQNFYLVTAVQTGIPAALVFLWLVAGHLHLAGAGYRFAEDPLLSGVALGCAGSLTSLLIVNVFTPTLVHGPGPAMILAFALSSAVGSLIERKWRASSQR